MNSPLQASHDLRSVPAALREVAERHPTRGVHLYDPQGVKEFMSFPQLLDGALRVAAELRQSGAVAGSRLVVVAPNDLEFVQVFLGALLAGVTPIPVGPPREGLDRQHGGFVTSLRRLAERLGAQQVVTPGLDDAPLADQARLRFERVWGARALVSRVEPPGDDALALFDALSPDDVAYVQLSSGATGPSRGAALTHGNLVSNIVAIGRHLRLTEADVGVSWLPLFHVMGLVGALLFSLVWGLPMVLLHPERFMAMPHEWLWAFPNHRATLSLAPDFGYHYCARRARRSELEGLDLSSWRIAISGGEPVHAHHAQTFARRFAPYGLKPEALTPVYGLGEATLAVSAAAPDQPPPVERLERDALERRGVAVEAAEDDRSAVPVVGAGRLLAGVTVEVRDPATGAPRPDGQLGELHTRGPCVMRGYSGEPTSDPRRGGLAEEGWLATGDLGYRRGDELFVVSRVQDTIRLPGGRALHPDPVEAALARIDGVRPGAVAVFGVPLEAARRHAALQQLANARLALSRAEPIEPDAELLIVAVETIDGLDQERLKMALARTLAEQARLVADDVQLLSPQSIPRTRSGKVQRYKCRRFYLEGTLDRRARQQRWQALGVVTERARQSIAQLGRSLRQLFTTNTSS